ncbi:hypothetical protein N7466_010640 [Penicillium verhagenii]|uniref:uncharacterized protein n=1 Tax=Penicillium verhagenii TaxID=1562060 RepID=UPI002544F321|nr:uncharacterized protein N7466_010640 [Penicillium verhagenii]KAJ5918648.1 hypothetical protein N7466_010640 [Penicillium verhagenii]
MSLKSITFYGHASGANPWKVVMVLEELAIPYTQKIMAMVDLKEPFESINPNGRVPAIQDPQYRLIYSPNQNNNK